MTFDASGSVSVRVFFALAVATTAAGQASALPPPSSAPGGPPPASRPSTAPVPSTAAVRASVIRFLEERIRRDPEDIVALNRLAGEYLLRFRDSGDDADIALSAKAAAQSLSSVPADLNKGG